MTSLNIILILLDFSILLVLIETIGNRKRLDNIEKKIEKNGRRGRPKKEEK